MRKLLLHGLKGQAWFCFVFARTKMCSSHGFIMVVQGVTEA